MVGVGPDLQRYKDFVSTNRIPNVRFEGQQSSEPYYNEASIHGLVFGEIFNLIQNDSTTIR